MTFEAKWKILFFINIILFSILYIHNRIQQRELYKKKKKKNWNEKCHRLELITGFDLFKITNSYQMLMKNFDFILSIFLKIFLPCS